MSKVFKGIGKIFKGVLKVAKKVVKGVWKGIKKYGKYIAMAVAIYFTAGAAMAMWAPTAGVAAAMPGVSTFTGMIGINGAGAAAAATGGQLAAAGAASSAAGSAAGGIAGMAMGAAGAATTATAAGVSAGTIAAGTATAAAGLTAFQKAQVGLALLNTGVKTIGGMLEPSAAELNRERWKSQETPLQASSFSGRAFDRVEHTPADPVEVAPVDVADAPTRNITGADFDLGGLTTGQQESETAPSIAEYDLEAQTVEPSITEEPAEPEPIETMQRKPADLAKADKKTEERQRKTFEKYDPFASTERYT